MYKPINRLFIVFYVKVRHFTVCKYTTFFTLLGGGVMLFSLEIRNKGDDVAG